MMLGTIRIGRHSRNVTQQTLLFTGRVSRSQREVEKHITKNLEFFKTFDNKLVNNPYKILFGDGNYTCSVADWTATMIGPMKGPGGKIVQPTHKTAKLEFCTVATWKNNEIIEEHLFYDVVGMMKRLGLM